LTLTGPALGSRKGAEKEPTSVGLFTEGPKERDGTATRPIHRLRLAARNDRKGETAGSKNYPVRKLRGSGELKRKITVEVAFCMENKMKGKRAILA